MDSYHITSDNIKTFKEAVTSQINDWKDGFLGVQESINSFILSDSYQGDIAFVLKEYLNNKYIAEGTSTTSVLVELFDLFLTALDEYEQLYQEYEGGEDFAFDYEVIDDSKVRLGDKIVEFLDSMDRIKGTLDSINGINTPSGTVDYVRPDTIMVETALEDGNSYIEQLHNDISDIETAGVDKADELEDDITHVTCVMMDYRDCCQTIDDPGFLQPKTLSDKEMGELLGLQSRDRNLLSAQELERLEELERKVQFGSDAAKQSYRYRYNTLPQNQRTNEMMAFNASLEISFSESTLSPSSKKVMEFMEQIEAYDNALKYETDPYIRSSLESQKAILEESVELEIERALSQSVNSEDFLYVNDYLVSRNIELEDRAKLFYYWDKLRDVEDISGIELPDWWIKKYIYDKQSIINENNVLDNAYEPSKEALNLYYDGYFVVDLFRGMGNQTYADKILDNTYIKNIYDDYRETGDATDFNNLFYRWYDYQYGGMYDYATGKDSVRAVKYALDTRMNFPGLYDEYGIYQVYDNNESGYYNFCVSAYIYKYGHAEEYFEAINTSDTPTEKVLSYIENDQYKPAEDKAFEPIEQELIKKNYQAYRNGELMYCKNMYDIADQLRNDGTVFSYGGDEYTVRVEGDKIVISACIIDSMAYASDRHWDEYSIDFSDCNIEAFGSVYIDSATFVEKMVKFSEHRYYNGWISKETLGDWEENVDAIIEQQAEMMGIDLNSLDDNTLKNLRDQAIIYADVEDKLIDVYLSNRKTASDEFNEIWDEMMLGAGVACSLLFFVSPVGIAEAATFAIGVIDGTKKIWQGDTASGATEIGIAALGEMAYVVKEVKEGRKVAKLMEGAAGAVDDLDFVIDASKFDDLEYIKANPLSENYYLTDEEIRYRQSWRRVEEGRNIMPEDEYAKWMYSDSKVGDYLTIEKVDYDDILSLRKSERMSQTIDDAASVKKIIASEGGLNSRFSAEEIMQLKKVVIDEGQALKDMGLTNKELGPAIAGAYDKSTGKIYTAINNRCGDVPTELSPFVKERIDNMPIDVRDSYIYTYGAGSHAEVYAVNKLLLDNPNARIEDICVYVNRTVGTSKPVTEIPFVTCPHCRYILDGLEIISNK